MVWLGGCRQILGLNDLPPDASIDAGCVDTCQGSMVHKCGNPDPVDVPCMYGCVMAGGAHCGILAPSGGGVLPTDLDPSSGLLATTLPDGCHLNSDDGSIDNGVRAAGPGTISGIGFVVRNNIAVFTFGSLSIPRGLDLVGSRPIALVAAGNITIDGGINGRPFCPDPGPGGFPGGGPGSPAPGSGGGAGGQNNRPSGGGGGGNGAPGGYSGTSIAGGAVFGDARITLLVGGGGGGGGGGNNANQGGGGGPGFQIVSASALSISGAINAGGCGGQHGGTNAAGAGGGAGGTLLLEALTIHLVGGALLAANGGGGGGGGGAAAGGSDGNDGNWDRFTAGGGGGTSPGARGGDGGAAGNLAGGGGDTGPPDGGGGGGVGWIRLDTLSGVATIDSMVTISPSLSDAGTTATQGMFPLQ
jgi:hypothetical protein